MDSYGFRVRRVKEPHINVRDTSNAIHSYNSSVAALEDAWNYVAAAKEELNSVDNKIRNVPLSDQNIASQRAYDTSNRSVQIPSRPVAKHRMLDEDADARPTSKHVRIEKPAKIMTENPTDHKENYLKSRDFDYSRDPTQELENLSKISPKRPLLPKSRKRLLSSKYQDGLSRIRDKVNLQKSNTLSYSSGATGSPSGNNSTDVLQSTTDASLAVADALLKEPMTRKVTRIHDAPAYQGFNVAKDLSINGKWNTSNSKHVERKLRQNALSNGTDLTLNAKPKPIRKNAKPKMSNIKNASVSMKRIVAANKVLPTITTSSWRVGQEAARKAIKESKMKSMTLDNAKGKDEAKKTAVEPDIPESAISSSKALKTSEKDLNPSKQLNKQSSSETAEALPSISNSVSTPLVSNGHDNDNISENAPIDESEIDLSDQQSISALSNHAGLPAPAREVLHEMLESDQDTDSESPQQTDQPINGNETRVIQTRPKKKEKRKTKGLKSIAVKESSPKDKMRHYDQEDVKKYMEKQIAERNKMRKQARMQRQVIAEQQRQKLQSLYNRQKKTLVANLKAKERGSSKYQHSDSHFATSAPLSDITSSNAKQAMDQLQSKIDSARAALLEDCKPKVQVPAPMLIHSDGESTPPIANVASSEVREPDRSKETINAQPESTGSETSRLNRIEAIRDTALSLRLRLDEEAKRLQSKLEHGSDWPSSYPPHSVSKPLQTSSEKPIFTGWLPGVDSLEGQAEENLEQDKMEKAALTIQAAYRGYWVRKIYAKVLLPSSRSMGLLKDSGNESEDLAASRRRLDLPAADLSIVTEQSSPELDSLLNVAEEVDSEASISYHRDVEKERDDDDEEIQSLRSLIAARMGGAFDASRHGDRYSVINIMARRMDLIQGLKTDFEDSRGAENYEDDFTQSRSNNIRDEDRNQYDDDFHDSHASTESTLKTIPAETSSLLTENSIREEVASNATISDPATALSTSSTSVISSVATYSFHDSDHVASKSVSTLTNDLTSRGAIEAGNVGQAGDDSSVVISPCRTPTSVHEYTLDKEKDPVMSSTMRNDRVTNRLLSDSDDDPTPKTSHVRHNEAEPMYSPGTLDRKMMAELNRLQSVTDSLHHVLDIERVRDVVTAQNEKAAVSHEMEARDYLHRQDMARLSLETESQNRQAAQEVEKIREETRNETGASTKRIIEAQEAAARSAAEAKQRMEEARRLVDEALNRATEGQLANVESITSKAASAAASSAVQSALQFHREQLENLRKDSTKRLIVSNSRSDMTSSRSYTVSGTEPGQRHTGVNYSEEEFETASVDSFHSDVISVHEESDVRESIHASPDSHDESEQVSLPLTEDHVLPGLPQSPSPSIVEELDASQTGTNISSRASTPGLSLKDTGMLAAALKSHRGHFDDGHGTSLTGDELEHEFRMVLPSEAHRRHSIDRSLNISIDDNASSSDEAVGTPKRGEHRVSPFANEHSFSRFTTEMVRSYIQEEEVRSRHQAALLKLREKALIEKTKAEMAWIELQKKRLKDKKADDQMPPLNKKQRGLMMKLQANQAEIRQLREAYKTASYERKFMLYQQKEIDKIRHGTGKILKRIGKDATGRELLESRQFDGLPDLEHQADSSTDASGPIVYRQSSAPIADVRPKAKTPLSVSASSDGRVPSSSVEIPEEVVDALSSSVNENQQSDKSQSHSITQHENSPTPSPTRADSFSYTDNSDTTISLDMQRLRKKTSEKYLSHREVKLRHRREQFASLRRKQDDLLEWKRRIDEEERRLKSDLQHALTGSGTKERTPSISDSNDSGATGAAQTTRSKSPPFSPRSTSRRTKSVETVLSFQSESDSSIVESLPALPQDSNQSPSSIQEALSNQESKNPSSDKFDYADETFESGGQSTSVTAKVSKGKETDRHPVEEQSSVSEVASDLSDIEKRVSGLEEQLNRRKRELEKIRRRRDRESLQKKEEKLIDELQAVELEITHANHGADGLGLSAKQKSSRFHSPKILSPKSSQHSTTNGHDVTPPPRSVAHSQDSERSVGSVSGLGTRGSHKSDNVTPNERHDTPSAPATPEGPLSSLTQRSPVSNDRLSAVSQSEIIEDVAKSSSHGDHSFSGVEDVPQYESDFDPLSRESSDETKSPSERQRSPSSESLLSIASQISGSKVTVQSEDRAILTATADSQGDRHATSSSIEDALAVSSSLVASVGRTSPIVADAVFRVGDRVQVGDALLGTVRFVGALPLSQDTCAGVELDVAMGTSDGTFQGHRYFTCPADHGIFLPLDSLTADRNEIDEKAPSLTQGGRVSDTVSIDVSESLHSDQDSVDIDVDITPKRVDVSSVAGRIAEQILSSLLQDTAVVMAPSLERGADVDMGTDGVNGIAIATHPVTTPSSSTPSLEVSESYVEPLPIPVGTVDTAIDNASFTLLHGAIDTMIAIKRSKDATLLTTEDEDSLQPTQVDGPANCKDTETLVALPDSPTKTKASLDSALLTAKLNDLKTMHNAIDDLLGAPSSEDEDDEDVPDVNEFFANNDILRLPDDEDDDDELVPLFGMTADDEDQVPLVPYTIAETDDLVSTAFIRLQTDLTPTNRYDGIEPTTEYFDTDGTMVDEHSCRVYRRMVFDLTRALLRDLLDYSKLKASRTQPWLKPPRKAFTKFTRLNHTREGEDLLTSIQLYVRGILGLSKGRPSLNELKQRLPLNTSKKDYVDALLVHELREEEPEWITYDLDELRVKYQLADSILDGLIKEVVDIITDVKST